ncbi:MAG TPA: RNA polymerase factor sigma-54 [Chitinophagaceae bacterium]
MLHQNLLQKQQGRILPQQIQLLNLFHLNSLELEHRLQQELEDNPLLEENTSDLELESEKYNKDKVQDYQDWEEYGYDDIPDYTTEYAGYLSSEDLPQRPLTETRCFRTDLKEQFRLLEVTEEEMKLSDYLIDSLSDNGLLEQELEKIAEDLSFRLNTWIEPEQLEKVLVKIQQLEPAGIATRSIQECLIAQLLRMNNKRPDVKKATLLIQNHYNDLRNRHMEKIMQSLEIDEDELKIVLQLVAKLKLKPISEKISGTGVNNNIVPDFVLFREGNYLEVSLYRQRSASLYLNPSWMETIQHTQKSDKTDKATHQYLKNKLQSAQWFINAIRQRESTMLKVMKAILHHQYEYFTEGDIKLLRPMILKNIADETGVDISTVSRITCNKYIQTPFGTLLLKDLFTEGLSNSEGALISNKVIQSTIEEVIESEEKTNPYTDQQLVQVLAERGIKVARRTIAKYREMLQIPVAQVRALWA